MKPIREIRQAIGIMLVVVAGCAFLGTFVWPVLSAIGGYFVIGASLASAALLWKEALESRSETTVRPPKRGVRDDR